MYLHQDKTRIIVPWPSGIEQEEITHAVRWRCELNPCSAQHYKQSARL